MTAQPSYAPPPSPTPPPSPLPPVVRWLGLGCGALMLLATIGSLLFFTVLKKASSGPEKAVHEFLAAAGGGDFAAAHDYFSAALKEKQPLDEFEKIGRANQQLFQVRETTFPSRSVSIDKAELAGTVTLTGGSNLPAEFSLVREGGQWKLAGYHIGSG